MSSDATDGIGNRDLQDLRSSKRRKTYPMPTAQFNGLFFSQEPIQHLSSLRGRRVEVLHVFPLILRIFDFLTAKEIEWANTLLRNRKMLRSFTQEGDRKIYDSNRTSTFVPLTKQHDTIAARIEGRAANMIGSQQDHVEALQLVHYTKGQHFGEHHDAGTINEETGEIEATYPRRVATLFVYLNTLATGEGDTVFTKCDLAVQPVAGSALVFPNVDSGGAIEFRTVHKVSVLEPR